MVVIAQAHQPAPGSDIPFADLVDTLSDALSAAGARVVDSAWLPALQAGTRWHCFEGRHCGGFLPDPRATKLVTGTAGEPIPFYASREELLGTIAPVDQETLDRRARLLDAGTGHTSELTNIRLVSAAIARQQVPTADKDVVALANALVHNTVRDWCLVNCQGRRAESAALLWTALVRGTPAPHRAHPAALLAVNAYLRGNTALATAATNAAISADPEHRLANLLLQVFETGMTPDHLRRTIGVRASW